MAESPTAIEVFANLFRISCDGTAAESGGGVVLGKVSWKPPFTMETHIGKGESQRMQKSRQRRYARMANPGIPCSD